MKSAYITGLGTFLPGPPVTNDLVESYLGTIENLPGTLRESLIRATGIQKRHYALDRRGGVTFSIEEMAENSLYEAITNSGGLWSDIELIATSAMHGDLDLPSLGHRLHARLSKRGIRSGLQTFSEAGGSIAVFNAISHCVNAIRLSQIRCGVVVTSERPSPRLQASRYQGIHQENASLGVYASRYMLSDGASAAILSDQPSNHVPSLRIELLHTKSFANDLVVEQFAGVNRIEGVTLKDTQWHDDTAALAERTGKTLIRRSTGHQRRAKLERGIALLKELVDAEKINLDTIDIFLPVIGLHSDLDDLNYAMKRHGIRIHREAWLSFLAEIGNIGGAYPLASLDSAMEKGILKNHSRILLFLADNTVNAYGFVVLQCHYPKY